MDFPKKQPSIFYLDQNRGYFYDGSPHGLLEINFPPEAINHLEVINEERLSNVIKEFIEANKILPCDIILLLSIFVTFEKDFTDKNVSLEDAEVKEFLDYVPFEDVLGKIINIGQKQKLVAVNKKLIEDIKEAFNNQKFDTVSVVPVSALQETIPDLSTNLNLQIVLDKADSIKQYSIMALEEPVKISSSKNDNNSAKNKRLTILTGIFVFLFLILLFIFYINILRK